MARLDSLECNIGAAGKLSQAEMICELGVMCASGRTQAVDLVAAHKWFNIAAIKGSDRAEGLRAQLTAVLSKPQLVQALREAREWMTMH